jgi:uncharacterized membrane protein YdjX (TVP38/TMEM64 family)/rhodanese-related sulfurtransferase
MTVIVARLTLVLVVGAALWLASGGAGVNAHLIAQWTGAFGPWAPALHVLLFALGTVLFVPGSLFGLAGGALFGPVLGTMVNVAGATLGAVAAFLIARYAAADWTRQKVGARLERLIAGVEAEGWRFVALVRLVPFFPFNLMNYALGLTRIALGEYALASLICMIPGTLAYSWLGHAGREAAEGSTDAIRYGLLGLAALAATAFVPRLIRRWREVPPSWIDAQSLSTALSPEGQVAVLDVRSDAEFDGPLGHIRGAVNIPVGQLADRIGELDAVRGVRVVTVCLTDKRSACAAAVLREAGFDPHVLRGGMQAWNEALLPVERTRATRTRSDGNEVHQSGCQ